MQACPSLPSTIAVGSFQSHSVYNCFASPAGSDNPDVTFFQLLYQSNKICARGQRERIRVRPPLLWLRRQLIR